MPDQQTLFFDSTNNTVQPPFLDAWMKADRLGDNIGAPRSAQLWMDGHLVQFFDTVLLEASPPPQDTPAGEDSQRVTMREHPHDWRSHVPEQVLLLNSAPQRADIAVTGAADEQVIAAPLLPLTLTMTMTIDTAESESDSGGGGGSRDSTGYTGPATLHLYDATLRPSGVITTHVQDGHAQVVVLPRGRLGPQWAIALVEGRIAGVNSALLTLDAETELHTGHEDLDAIYPMVRSFMEQDVVSYELDGRVIRGYRSPDNPLIWLRDHVYQGRGFRYFERDMTSTLDAFRRAQREDGSFPDVLTHPGLNIKAHRLESESDLEFLFVQGVHEAWQATGDDNWLLANMDAMYHGIDYLTSDPWRWNSDLGLVQRPYTIDMWDFQYGPTTVSPDNKPSPRHWVDEFTIWGVFHGDNTGLAYALKLLERTENRLGNIETAWELRDQRNQLMERLHTVSWNRPYFTHFVLQDGTLPQVPGVDTSVQLSLSNAYALNREVLQFEQCRGILETYHRRRDFSRAFAEWYSIDPPFPAGSFGMGGGKGEQPGEYVNGGIMPLVGGELSRGAFGCGAEEYGFDILLRYAELIRLTGASYLWYYPDGRPGISSKHTLATDGWGSSAMLGALIEGAAGVVDSRSLYRDIDVSPRWSALPDIRTVRVVARYAASEGYVAYTWEYEQAARQLRLQLTGSWEKADIRLLLPPDGRDTEDRTRLINGKPYPFEKKKVGTGQYIVAEDVEGGNANVVLTWIK
jgi:hypothetical protein